MLGLLALVAVACVPAGAERPLDDHPALSVSGDALRASWSEEGEHLVSPPIATEGDVGRLAVMLEGRTGALAPDGLFEGRGVAADGAVGPWQPLEAVFHEGALAVARVDLASPAQEVQLRLRMTDAPEVVNLTVAADPPVEVDEASAAEEAVATSARGLSADLAAAGILPRSAWGARARRCGNRDQPKVRMAIHHAVTARTQGGAYEPVLRMIQAFHMDGRGYCDVGYHFFVTADGRVWEAREVDILGGHSGNYNGGNIGIVFVGCFDGSSACDGLGGTNPPEAMMAGAARAIGALARKFGIPIDADRIKGHGQQPYQATACPGSVLRGRLEELRQRARGAPTPTPTPTPTPAPGPGAPSRTCGALLGNEVLGPGQTMPTCNGAYRLAHQTDGNVVLYNSASGRAVWHTGTNGKATSGLVMQGDGNLVLYGRDGRALWASNTAGKSGATLAVQDDGNVVVVHGGRAVWATNTAGAGQPAPADCGRLTANQTLAPGASVTSCDGRFVLVHQGDGNVVLYQGSRALWHTRTNGSATARFVMQGDGNLVLYAPDGRALWNSGTHRYAGARLAVQDDGNVVIYAADGRAVWATNTRG
ncbi:MAG: N-acetylmuramoyl-L-alanine amidase [Deltaproteobacteria bacterium]|nr:N-acetylmuramoyl-L-alanine amidase [Deltaproteobacteria bacterium]